MVAERSDGEGARARPTASSLTRLPAHPGRSVLFAYAGIGVPAAIAVLLIPLLLRNLGAARFGLLSLLLSVSAFFMSFDFGTGPALARYSSRVQARPGSDQRIGRLALAGMVVQACVGLGTAAVLFVGLRWASRASAVNAGVGESEFGWAVSAVAAATPFALQSGGARSVLEGMGRFGLANSIRAPASASTFAAPIAVSFFSPRLDLMMAGLLAARVATSVAFGLALWRSLPAGLRPIQASYLVRVGKRLLGYGGWVMLGVAAGGLMSLGILDRLLLDNLLGPAAIVPYSIPSDIILRGLLAPAAIASVLIPLLSVAVVQDRALGPALDRAGLLLSSQVGPLALVLVLNAEWILQLLARGYVGHASRDILLGMAVGFYVHAVAHAPFAALQALGRPKHASIRHVLELPFYALASFLLVRSGRIEWMGVLWATWAVVDIALLAWLVKSLRPEIRLVESGVSVRFGLWVAGLTAAAIATRTGLPRAAGIATSVVALVYWAIGTMRLALGEATPRVHRHE